MLPPSRSHFSKSIDWTAILIEIGIACLRKNYKYLILLSLSYIYYYLEVGITVLLYYVLL